MHDLPVILHVLMRMNAGIICINLALMHTLHKVTQPIPIKTSACCVFRQSVLLGHAMMIIVHIKQEFTK